MPTLPIETVRTRTKSCTRCGEVKPLEAYHRRRHYVRLGVRAACKACTRETGRQARATRGVQVDPAKQRVRARTREAIRQGRLQPMPCRICGFLEVQAHHPRYDREDAHLHVEWLCRRHHAQEHGRRAWTHQLELLFPVP